MASVLKFPRQDTPQIIRTCRPCQRCGTEKATLELRRYPLNRAVAWFCAGCTGINRSNGRLFIPHRELACAIDPDCLRGVRA